MFTAMVFWIKKKVKLILFFGQQTKSSTEQIRNTAVKNKGAGKKRWNIDDALLPNLKI